MQNKIPKYSVYVLYIHLPIYIHKLKLQERIKSGIHFQTSVHIKTRTREQVTYRTSSRTITVCEIRWGPFMLGRVHGGCCWNSSSGTDKVCQGQVQGTESSEFYASSTRSWTGGPMARQMLLTCAPLVTVTESRLQWYSFSCVNI